MSDNAGGWVLRVYRPYVTVGRLEAIQLSSTERAAPPLAIARQPLWSIGGRIALLDDENAVHAHAVGTYEQVSWALKLMDELVRWQDAFTG